jgi:hypothetical protein
MAAVIGLLLYLPVVMALCSCHTLPLWELAFLICFTTENIWSSPLRKTDGTQTAEDRVKVERCYRRAVKSVGSMARVHGFES